MAIERNKLPLNARTSIPLIRRVWFEAVVKDDQGQPLAGWSYELETPNGQKRKGTVASDGKIRDEDVVPGTCKLKLLSPPPEGLPKLRPQEPTPTPAERVVEPGDLPGFSFSA